MLQFTNSTPYPGTLMVIPDVDGVESIVAIIRGTFDLRDLTRQVEEQIPVVLKDEYHGEPGRSSIRVPSDLSLPKPGTDILLSGRALAPGGRAVPMMYISLQVGPVKKRGVVFGDRTWRSDVLMREPSAPKPFTVMPLIWEQAFGGSDGSAEAAVPAVEARNPVGRGFRLKNNRKSLTDLELPNIEDPASLISSPGDRPVPMGFAAVAPMWEPRSRFAGTYDEEWERSRAPYLPDDFDPRFFQLAPADQVVPGFLNGGEPVEIIGMNEEGRLTCRLPKARMTVTYAFDDGPVDHPANLDTVHLLPDENRLTLIWRTVIRTDKKTLRVREVKAFMAGSLS